MNEVERAGLILSAVISSLTLFGMLYGWARGYFSKSISTDNSIGLSQANKERIEDHSVALEKQGNDIKDQERRLTYLEVKHEKDLEKLSHSMEGKISSLKTDMDSRLTDLKNTLLTQLNTLNMNNLKDQAETRELLEKISDRQFQMASDMGELKAKVRG